MTRQRKWQIEKQLDGKCVICGEERNADSALHCEKHRAAVAKRSRNRYRVAHGIPIHITKDLRRTGGGK